MSRFWASWIEQGKGRKDRYAMLSEPLFALLRAWWLVARDRGVMLPTGGLFPGQNPVNPLTIRLQPGRPALTPHLVK